MIGEIVGAVGQLGAAAMNLIGARKAAQENRELMQMQFDHSDAAATTAYMRQREMANDMNLYNSPVAQRERYEAAGLNPYLMYQNGGATVSAATANVQQANTPTAPITPNYLGAAGDSLANGVTAAVNNFVQFKRLENETKLADAQAKSLLSNASNTDVATRFAEDTYDLRLSAQRWNNMLTAAHVGNVDVDTMQKRVETELVDWKKKNLEASTAEINTQREYLLTQKTAQEVLNRYIDQKESAQLANILADTRKKVLEGNYTSVATSLQHFIAETQRISANANMLGAKSSWFNAGTNYANHLEDVRWHDSSRSVQERGMNIDEKARTTFTEKDFGNAVTTLLNTTLGNATKPSGSTVEHQHFHY